MTIDGDVAEGAAVLCALGALPDRERHAFIRYRVQGLTGEQVAAELGVCRERVRQLSNRAERKLRQELVAYQPAELAAA